MIAFLDCRQLEVFRTEGLKQVPCLFPRFPFCAYVDVRESLIAPHHIEGENDKVCMTLKPPVSVSQFSMERRTVKSCVIIVESIVSASIHESHLHAAGRCASLF